MHRVRLTYTLHGDEAPHVGLHHPLLDLLAAVHDCGSISGAARRLQRSYRHVWGELKRWELELGQPLVHWAKGQPALLSPFGSKLLWAERRAQARLAPQIEALRSELELAFAVAFDRSAGVLTVAASHDEALPLLRQWALERHKLHLDMRFCGSLDALAALNAGQCLLAGFHALADAPPGSPTARAYRPLLQPGRHKLLGFAQRRQGLMVARGNPLRLQHLRDLCRPGLRFAARGPHTGTHVLLQQLLVQHGIDAADVAQLRQCEPSHRAAAQSVASGAADAGFGIEAAARALGLDFVPLASEQYFLVVLRQSLQNPQVATLQQLLRSPGWQQQLDTLPGYAAARSGEVLSLNRVLPWWRYRRPKR